MADVKHIRAHDRMAVVTLIGDCDENGIILETDYMEMLEPAFSPAMVAERIARRSLIVDAARYDGGAE